MMTVSAVTILDVFKAPASDVRFEMVRILAHGEHCVCDLEALWSFHSRRCRTIWPP
jgi:ArsR family transcriptional regulator